MKTRFRRLLIVFFTCIVQFALGQEKKVTGTVNDENNMPLPGATVLIQGTSTGVATDFDGKYAILAKEGDVLEFTYVGYATQKIKVTSLTIINVSMQPDSASLSEVVVTAYGIKKEYKALGYATANVRAEADVARLLQGKASGVRITQQSGVAGSGTNLPIRGQIAYNNDSYASYNENVFEKPELNPLSTFSIDVDRASYTIVRRMINNGQSIPKDAVKIEEFINYFKYDYSVPSKKSKHPFSITTDLGVTPWNPKTKLVRIGVQGKKIDQKKLPASNLVFLIDVSGSMNGVNKLGLVKHAFKRLVKQLREKDRVSIVVYAGAAGVVLEPTRGDNTQKIFEALDQLTAGGSTAGGEGIELAYDLAQQHFIKNGNNRVILATDGDFNVGASSKKQLEKLIENKRKSGVFLTCLGFGYGNYKDDRLELLAQKGNGNHAYIDTSQEADKVFGAEFGGTLYTIAKDVKIQVEFNPMMVESYRLIGYENRLLHDKDFKDDTKDAGELGNGHTVTALYELVLKGSDYKSRNEVDELKYGGAVNNKYLDELLTVKLRYKNPDKSRSIELNQIVKKSATISNKTDYNFSAAVALGAMVLKKSKFCNGADLKDVIRLAEQSRGKDDQGYRAEFVRLMKLLN